MYYYILYPKCLDLNPSTWDLNPKPMELTPKPWDIEYERKKDLRCKVWRANPYIYNFLSNGYKIRFQGERIQGKFRQFYHTFLLVILHQRHSIILHFRIIPPYRLLHSSLHGSIYMRPTPQKAEQLCPCPRQISNGQTDGVG